MVYRIQEACTDMRTAYMRYMSIFLTAHMQSSIYWLQSEVHAVNTLELMSSGYLAPICIMGMEHNCHMDMHCIHAG